MIMLVKIDGYITDDWNDSRHKLDYQYSKLNSEKGSLLFSSCDDNAASELHNFFAERAMLYNTISKRRNVKNIAKCFIISMPPGEYPSEETFIKIGDRLLEKMGYSECPWVIFQHSDTDKSHVHIIVSTITDEMTHVDNADDYTKCFEVARALEKEFGFSELKKASFSKITFQEIASRKYYYQNALQKALRQDKTSEFSNLFTADVRQKIMRQSLTNDLMVELLGEETYNRVGEMLKSKNMFHKYFKAELIDRLETLYQHSQNDDFLKYAKDNGIYIRHVKDTLIYGIPELSFYVNENSLPRKYHYKSLKEGRTTFKLESEQQQYIFESFCNSCYGTPKAFLYRLNTHQILAKDHHGKLLFVSRDVTGNFGDYSFIDATAPDAQWVKGADLSKKLSGMTLKDILENKYTHQYRLSDTFRQPDKVQDDMFSKALKKAFKNHAVQARLDQLVPDEVRTCMNQYPMDRNQYQILMSEPSFDAIKDILYKGGFFHSFYLDSLKKDLDAIFDRANGDRSMFLLFAEEKGIKIRLLKNQTLMYEIQGHEGTFRFKENRLPQKFRNAMLAATPQKPIYKLQEEQYRHVFEFVRNSLKESVSLKDFFAQLASHQIYVFDENMKPVNEQNGSNLLFGQSVFADHSCINPVLIPGNTLSKNMAGKTMNVLLNERMSAYSHFSKDNYPAVFNFASVHSHYTPDDNFIKRKKRKRGIGDIDMT